MHMDSPALSNTGQTTVLVVDDEVLVRMVAVEMLIDAGFAVIEAEGASSALEALSIHPEITVLFSDINMPGAFDGLELARRVHLLRPDVQLILTSGLMGPVKGEIPGVQFVPKPYNSYVVADLIRAASKADRVARD